MFVNWLIKETDKGQLPIIHFLKGNESKMVNGALVTKKEDKSMKTETKWLAVLLVVFSVMSGCATVEATISGANALKAQMIPSEIPMPVKSIEVYDTQLKKRIEADVLSLSSAEIRGRLTSTETFISVQKRDTSGSLTYMGAGGKVSKGSYRVTFDYANYTNQNIKFDGNDSTAIGRIGVGLRITADLETSDSGVDLSGLIPIGLAAQDKKVSGQLSFRVYGMSNDKIAFAVPSQSILDVSAIQQSFEAAAAVRVMFGLEDTKLEPYLIGVADIKPADAKKALAAASQKLTSTLLGSDRTLDVSKVENEIKDIFINRKAPSPPAPSGLNHIWTFFEEPISTGEGIKAENTLEAWVMAYIEKHMGEYEYHGTKIYLFETRNKKRDAIIRLVKEKGANVLLDQIAPHVIK